MFRKWALCDCIPLKHLDSFSFTEKRKKEKVSILQISYPTQGKQKGMSCQQLTQLSHSQGLSHHQNSQKYMLVWTLSSRLWIGIVTSQGTHNHKLVYWKL